MYKGHYQPSSDCTATNVLFFSVRDNLQGIGLVVSLLYVLTTSETDIFTSQTTFRRWSRFTWNKVQRQRRDIRRDFKKATKTFEAAMESVNCAQAQVPIMHRNFMFRSIIMSSYASNIHSFILQVDMWLMKKDIYTDRNYWQHKLTQLITFDKPGLQHYLPVRVYCIVLCCAY